MAPQPADIGSNIASILAERGSERYALHACYMNEMIVRMLRTLVYDVCFRSGEGPYLLDDKGNGSGQHPRTGAMRSRIAIQMAFACHASDHQSPHL